MALKFIETKNKTAKLSRREWLIVFCAFLVILVSFIFPQQSFGETFWMSFLFFAIFPFIIVYFLIKEPFANFGFSWGKMRNGLIYSLTIIIIFIFFNYYLVFHSKLTNQLPIARGITNGFLNFLLFEFAIALPLHLFWEIFFRGFIQLGLENKLGIYSLVLATTLQVFLSLKGSRLALFLTFLSSLAAGLIVRQSRSIFYSAFALWIISISLDIMIIRLVNQS